MTKLVLEIEFADREEALKIYANLIGVPRRDLVNTGIRASFSGTVREPNLFTLLRPASVHIREEALDHV